MSIEPSSNPQSGDVVTVDRKQVALLWRRWTQEEARLVERLSALVAEMQTLLETMTPVTQTRFDLLDLFFTDAEQNRLFKDWESHDDRPETL